MIRKRTFSYKLNLYVVSLLLIISAIIFSLYLIISRNYLLKSAEQNAGNIAAKNAFRIETVLESTASVAVNIAKVIEQTELKEEDLLRLIENVVTDNESIYGSTVAFEPYSYAPSKYYYSPYYYKENGRVVYKNLGNSKYEYFFQDWYQIPKYLNRPVWSEPYYDEGGGDILMTTYSVPIYKSVNGQKSFWGIYTVDISLDWLQSIVSSIKVFQTGFAFVVSSTGVMVTHPDSKFIMNESIFSIAEQFNEPIYREIGRDMIKGGSGFTQVHSINADNDSYMFYTPLNSSNWSLAVVFPEGELYADLHSLSYMIIIIGLFGLAIIVFSVAKVSNKLTMPLHKLSEAAKEIGEGKINANLPLISTADEVEDLYNSFLKMQKELNNYIENLKKTTADKEKIESELRIAHQIQMGMLPKIFPPFPERDDIDLHAFLEPAKEVGGDLYDFFFVEDDKLVILVGDVAGKGVPASLFMAVTRTLIRSKMIKGKKLSLIVDEINRNLMADNSSKMFVTLFICQVDLKTGEVEFTNAGHNYPYVVSADGAVKPVEITNGMALGVFEIMPYSSGSLKLEVNDKLVLYTDGVNEAMNKDDEMFDYIRFEKALSQTNIKSAKESTGFLLNEIKAFTQDAEQSDDITLLVFQKT